MPIHKPNPISKAKLKELDNALCRIRRNPIDGPMIDRFGYDHGNTLIYDTAGGCDLLIENSTDVRRDCARLLQFCSPAMLRELWRGYVLARQAGLLESSLSDAALAIPTTGGERAMVPEIPFDPTNHHNALKCPYCNPQGLSFAPATTGGDGK